MAAEIAERDEPTDFREVRIPRELVISQQGRDYVLSDGLITGLHQLSGGYFDVETRLEQLPSDANGMLAVCSAKVTVFSPDDPGRVLRSATGIGDASPGSVGRLIQPHIIRMAETRALSRALRTLLCLGMAALEELGPEEPVAAPARTVEVHEPVERIMIEGQSYSRPQVEAAYKKRVEQAKAAGLALGQVDVVPIERTPLAVLAGKSQELRRRLEAKGAGK